MHTSRQFTLKAIAITVFCLLLLMTTPSTYAQAGLVSHWPGEGNALDNAGINNGTPVNGTAFTAGVNGQAFNFDGLDDRVSVPNSGSLNVGTGDFTVSFFAKFNDLANNGNGLVHKDTYGNEGAYRGWLFNICDNCAGSPGIGIETRNIGQGIDNNARYPTSNFQVGRWYHIAAVRRSNVLYLYIDGVLRTTVAESSPTDLSNTADLEIGSLSSGSRQDFAGALDEVNFFNRALSASEIQSLDNIASPDAVPDFSINANPNGVWSYGYTTLTDPTFTAFTFAYHNNYLNIIPGLPVDIWTRPTANQPLIMRNNSSGVVTPQSVVLPPDLLCLHPGPAGERSVLRWTAPASGTFQFQGRFQGLDNGSGTTTDVAITHNDVTALFNENVVGYGAQRTFLITRQVLAGDTIDFSVGYGFNNTYNSDSTGLSVVVTLVSSDSTPPVVTPTVTGTLGNGGWYTSDVNVSWSITDPESTVSSSTGCDSTSVTADTVGVTLTCTAASGGGSSSESVTIKRDATAPSVSCASADGVWHSSDVSIGCTGNDSVSQLANAGDDNFSLATSVPAGTETANAATGSRNIFDSAGNFATAGPINGNKIDKKAPTITITTPTSALFLLNQSIAASFTCLDGGAGVATCDGTAPNGGNIDTASVGSKSFTVSATDNVGNASQQSMSYTVGYGISVLFDQTKAAKSGSVIPIKLQLVDALGHNVSSPALLVHAVSLIQIASSASEIINDAGNSNPDSNFRFDQSLGSGGGYIFNLKTTRLSTGTYSLGFTVDADPGIYSVQFAVRQ